MTKNTHAKVKKTKTRSLYDFDLIVIGSGSGGGVGAHIAADAGKRVAIVEAGSIGGECPNFGCVPTKALLRSAEAYRETLEAPTFGVKTTGVTVNHTAAKKWKDQTVRNTGTWDGENAFRSSGIEVIKGYAHFIGPHEITVNRKRYTAQKFLIASGTTDFIPPLPGLEETGYITYKEALDLKPPKSMLIIGGGPIGCEFAEYFSTMGTDVSIAEYGARLLGNEDKEVGELMKAVFEQRGLNVLCECEIQSIKQDRSKKVITYKSGGKMHEQRVDEILVATGKRPNTDIGLENAGVKHTPRGITVNNMMQTSAKHIYAAGDVAGPYAFTHMASYQSRTAVHNMFKRKKVITKYHAVPRCVFTSPEVATVGMTEKEAREQKVYHRIAGVPISIIGRSNTSNEDIGFVKVMVTTGGVIIGASIIAPRAGEMIHELALAVSMGLKAEDVANTIHAFPTWSEAVRIACAKLA